MRTTIFLAVGVVLGAILGGFCGWAINARYWGVIRDPESFWLWWMIGGGVVGAVLAMVALAVLRPRRK